MKHLGRMNVGLVVTMSVAAVAGLGASACSGDDDNGAPTTSDGGTDASMTTGDGAVPALTGNAGPDGGVQMFPHPVGSDLDDGKQVFRFETFGNEGYWTKVLELPQGMIKAGVTPAQALSLGLSVDIDAVPADMKATIASQLAAVPAGGDPSTIAAFQDPANTVKLIEANAVIGFVTRQNNALFTGPLNGTIDVNDSDVFAGESVGASCAICHGITDGSTLKITKGGTIGHRVDGPSNHNLQFGKVVALANHSIGFYPTLALDLVSNNHGSASRKGVGVGLISAAPTEAEVDAYLNDDTLYPIGMFDDQPDGNGAPMHIQPLFRTDLAAPWGSDTSIHTLQNFSNLVYTALLDATDLLAPGVNPNDPSDAGADAATFTGPQYLEFEKGGPAGLELLTNYKAIIETQLGIPPYSATADGGAGNNGYPYVARPGSECAPAPAGVENEPSIGGLKCTQSKLLDMNAYLNAQRAPAGFGGDAATIATGRNVFRGQCTTCHNDDQSLFVPQDTVAFNNTVDLYANAPSRPDLFPGWDGKVLGTRPGPPFAALVPLRDSVGIYDDKFVITEASNYMQPRGVGLPLLMDLANKRSFLHDDEVVGTDSTDALGKLLDPSRGATSPHPFYVTDATQRAAVITFLQSLDDNPLH